VGVLRSIAAAAATMMSFWTPVLAEGDGPSGPSFLFFAGSDLWRYGAFVNGGSLWSPAGLDNDGFAVKVLVNGGMYTYPSGGLRTDVRVTQLSGTLLPGWRITNDGAIITLYAGPIVQDYKLSPYDPNSLLRGFYTGADLSGDLWYQPNPASMIALDGSIASIALIGSARAATGWQLFDDSFVGPEAQALWCIDYRQWRLGGHLTAFRNEGFEWSAAAGIAVDSFRRVGPYLRLGVIARY
jgi:Cellulose biosynthesis protein BcsS